MSRSVIAYFRMSDDDQTNSIERQRQTYHTFLKNNQDDYESLGEFVEAGKSGGRMCHKTSSRRTTNKDRTEGIETRCSMG